MKKLFLFLTCAFLIGMMHAQILEKKAVYTPPAMQNYSNGTQALCDTVITFFNIFSSSVGYGGAVNWRAAIFVDSIEFQPYSGTPIIDAVQFQIENLALLNSVTLEIYEGSVVSNYTNSATLTNGNLIYSQDVTADVVQNAFGVHTLPTPISINKSLGYTVLLVLDQNAAGFPMAVDNGPIVPAKGGWISPAGAPFTSIASISNANWGIKLCMDGNIIDADHDVRVDEALFTPTGYEITPVDQLDPSGYNFWVDAENIGNFTTDITTKIDVNSGSFVDSTTITSVTANTIGRGNLPTPYIIPSVADTYTIEASVSIDSTDYNPLDNIKNGSFIISDTDSLIYSRTSSSNFFTANGRFNGNVYEVHSTETWIKSVKAEYYNPSVPILTDGMELVAQIWQVTNSNTIGALLYTSDTITLSGITSSTGYNFDFTFYNTPAVLIQGKYLVTVTNPGCLLMNSDINYYEPNTAFVNSNPANPNWVETADLYYRIDLLLSDCANFVQFDGVNSNYCLTSPSVQLSGIPSGGTYSGPGVSGSIFDPSVAGLGNHTIVYDFTSSGGCNASDTMIITVSTKPIITISGLDSSYCVDDSAAVLSATPFGGTFNGSGIIGNEFRPGTAGAGNHMITYTYNSNGCGGSDTAMVTVNTPPIASISGLDSIYCTNSLDVTFTTSPTGGVLNGTGLNGNVFSPSTAGVGTHTVHYSVTTNGCTGVDSVIITVTPPTSIDFSTQTVGTSVSFTNLSSNDAYGYQWDFGDGIKSNDENPTHAYTSFGTYNVCLTAIGCAGVQQYCTDVFVVDSSSLSINELLDKAISVYPNPTNGDLNIKITASGEHALSYSLLDITGRSILTNSTNLETNALLTLDLNSIENGIYFLQLNVEGNRITKKIVVEK